MFTEQLEASVSYQIITQLENLGWNVDETDVRNCDVLQQRAKTEEQRVQLKGKKPDFILYEKGTTRPIGIIEAKRPGQSLEKALDQAEKYATKIEAPLVFAYNGTYLSSKHVLYGRSLRIDGEELQDFIDHAYALRFVHEGPEILGAPQDIAQSREQLIKIFKTSADLLREDGLQAGLERFCAFADIIFLKILDELSIMQIHAGNKPLLVEDYLRWENLVNRSAEEMYSVVKDTIWKRVGNNYGEVFGNSIPVKNPEILKDMFEMLAGLNLTASDTDIKGDAFEYFLKNAYQGLSIKDLGEYFTPRNIVRTMVGLVNPKVGEEIYDPFCGTGGFLIESFRYLRSRVVSGSLEEKMIKEKSVHGGEITSNARIAKMNMILFGDGHNNIKQQDSFEKMQKNRYDIVLTNPPYSQKTRHGKQYPIPSSDGDAISVLHCFESLKNNGRAALLVKEDFLTEGGAVGKVREYIYRNSSNFSVVSLPRKIFEPYTPTKTSIVYFEKAGKRKSTFFYVIKNVGHTLNSRKKPLQENDLPAVSDRFIDNSAEIKLISCIVENEKIIKNDCSLWIYDYLDIIPTGKSKYEKLGLSIEPSGENINPSDFPEERFNILGVNNKTGVFFNEQLYGKQIKQKYIRVRAGDIVYNPHRVNVGSIGIVDKENEGGLVSNIYVVFRSINSEMPAEYICSVLKSPEYLQIIGQFDTRGAVRANLNYEQLSRINVPVLEKDDLVALLDKLEIIRVQEEHIKNLKENINGSMKDNVGNLQTIEI